MHTSKSIEHPGVIQQIEGSTARVVFQAHSACSACHAKGVCSVAGTQEKSVDVIHDGNVETGEKVNVVLKQSLGYKALLLGYIIPFLVVLVSLIVFSSLLSNEALAGLYSLALLVPYYIIIYCLRNTIRREFSFTIRKLT